MSDNNHDLDIQLIELLYDELDTPTAEALRVRIDADPSLSERLHGWATIRSMSTDLEELEPDPQVHYSILRSARIAATPDKATGFSSWFQWLVMSPTLAGLGLVIVAGSLYVLMTGDLKEGNDHAPTKQVSATISIDEDVTLPARPASGGAKAKTELDKLGKNATKLGPNNGLGVLGGSADEPGAKGLRKRIKSKESGRLNGKKAAEAPRPNEQVKPKRKAVAKVARKRLRGTGVDYSEVTPEKPSKYGKSGTRKRGKTLGKRVRRKSKLRSSLKRAKKRKSKGSAASLRRTLTRKVPVSKTPIVPQKTTRRSAPVRFAPSPPPVSAPSATASAQRVKDRRDISKNARAGSVNIQEPVQDEEEVEVPEMVRREKKPRSARRAGQLGDADGFGQAKSRAKELTGQVRRRAAAAKAVQVGDVDSGSSSLLDKARRAQKTGNHRRAVVAFEAYLTGAQGQKNLDQVWYEAALSYEKLGNYSRAGMLFRLAARGRSKYAPKARRQLAALMERQAERRARAADRTLDIPAQKKSASPVEQEPASTLSQ